MIKIFASAVFVSTFAILAACSSSSSPTIVKKPPPVVDAAPSVDSGVDATEVVDASEDTGVDSGIHVAPIPEAGPPVFQDVAIQKKDAVSVEKPDAVVAEKDSGHDSGPSSCSPPQGTYTYAFTTVSGVGCDNTLQGYSVGPVPLGSLSLAGLLPGFCNTTGDVGSVSDLMGSVSGCSASQTFTCADPTTGFTGSGDPMSNVSVSTVSSNADATKLTGTLSLQQTDETSHVECTETYSWTATATQ